MLRNVVCPACAGMIRVLLSISLVGLGLPRMRGDDPSKDSDRD